jgi:hypothetical protein
MPTQIKLTEAEAINTHGVLVTLNIPPLALDGLVEGDALNPDTWFVSRLDSGAALTVLQATLEDSLHVLVTVLEPLGDVHVTHLVATSTLKGASGETLDIGHAAYNFFGTVADPVQPQDVQQPRRPRDLANPQASKDTLGGSLTVVGGDYATVEGAELVKKLVLRRLLARPGDYFHLPDYGLGLREKEHLNGGGLVSLKAAIERACLLEPEVAQVQAVLTQSADGATLTAAIKMTTRGGQPISFTTPNLAPTY